jgi:hypothetical protein
MPEVRVHYETVTCIEGQDRLIGFIGNIIERIGLVQSAMRTRKNAQRAGFFVNVVEIQQALYGVGVSEERRHRIRDNAQVYVPRGRRGMIAQIRHPRGNLVEPHLRANDRPSNGKGPPKLKKPQKRPVLVEKMSEVGGAEATVCRAAPSTIFRD